MARTSTRGRRGNNDGSLYYEKGRDRWHAVVDDYFVRDVRTGELKPFHRTSKNRGDAARLLQEALIERDSGRTGMTGGWTVAEWLEHWVEDIVKPTRRPTTYRDYRTTIQLHLIPRLGRSRLEDLTAAEIRQAMDNLKRARSLSTANKAHRVLKAALSGAEAEDLIIKNRAKAVKMNGTRPKRRNMPTDAVRRIEAAALDDLTPHGARHVMTIYCGARQGERLGLTRDNVDFDRGTIDVSWKLEELVYEHGCPRDQRCGRKRAAECPMGHLQMPDGFEYIPLAGRLALTRPKTEASIRVFPLPAFVLDAIQAHMKATAWTPRPYAQAHLVWHDGEGRALTPKADLESWRALLKKAGVDDHFDVHAARHTVATELMRGGVDVKIAQSIFGHTAATTTQMYQHVDLSDMQRAMGVLASRLHDAN